jgi:hypothetical protein
MAIRDSNGFMAWITTSPAIINLEAQNFMLPFAIKRLWRIFVIEKGGKF